MARIILVRNLFVCAWITLLCVLTATSKEVKPSCEFKDPDIKFFDVKISPTYVPTNLTTYVCQLKSIPIPLDRDYHAIAFLPLVNNTVDIVHHMILFGCPEANQRGGVHYCGGGDNSCRHFLAQWSRKLEGPICNHPKTGVKFGLSSTKSLSLQIHWNNALNTEGLVDASGFRVYYTSTLRKYDLGNVQIGQNDLEIPPGQSDYPQSGGCSSECTKEWLPHPIYLTRAHIHMHYTGSGGSMQIIRNGNEIHEVLNDTKYDYDKPPSHSFSKPIQVLPGDQIKVTCRFNTKDGLRRRTNTLHWGEGSDGEMCYAFVSYYPIIKNFDQCIQFDQYDICTKDGISALGECIFPGFVHVFVGMGDEIVKQCSVSSAEANTVSEKEKLCSAECKAAVSEVTNHSCMQGRLEKEARRLYLPQVPTWPKVDTIMKKAGDIICH